MTFDRQTLYDTIVTAAAEVGDVDLSGVDRNADLFDLEVDSLLFTTVLVEVEERLGEDIPAEPSTGSRRSSGSRSTPSSTRSLARSALGRSRGSGESHCVTGRRGPVCRAGPPFPTPCRRIARLCGG